jgi:hypothetical protein
MPMRRPSPEIERKAHELVAGKEIVTRKERRKIYTLLHEEFPYADITELRSAVSLAYRKNRLHANKVIIV